MRPVPDYSPSTLRTFLFARTLAREGFDRSRRGRVNAQRDLARELMQMTGLPLSSIDAAFQGRLTEPGKRAAIWAVIGHFPGDHGQVLMPGGRQAPQVASGAGA